MAQRNNTVTHRACAVKSRAPESHPQNEFRGASHQGALQGTSHVDPGSLLVIAYASGKHERKGGGDLPKRTKCSESHWGMAIQT
jgi:hypothetical protein